MKKECETNRGLIFVNKKYLVETVEVSFSNSLYTFAIHVDLILRYSNVLEFHFNHLESRHLNNY